MTDLHAAITALRKEKHAVILAHNYVSAELQDIADFCGDSLELAQKARQADAPLIVVCGVRFMAETAKILSPDATVLLVNSDAGCPMADQVDAGYLRRYREQHPEAYLIAYVNTTAAVKACVDCCCTSSNAEKIAAAAPADRPVLFLPDRNLGANVAHATGRNMELFQGCCPIHDAVCLDAVRAARTAHPNATMLVHPECKPEILQACDHALSTGGILKFVRESAQKEFIIVTEEGILHRLRKENPDKVFFTLPVPLRCDDMKKITLDNLHRALEQECEKIELPPELIAQARKPIERMLDLSR